MEVGTSIALIDPQIDCAAMRGPFRLPARRGRLLLAACLWLALIPSSAAAHWSAPVTLSPSDDRSDFHALAGDNNGDLVAIWRHGSIGQNVPQWRIRPAGGSWGALQQSTVEGTSVLGANAAITPGEALLTWLGQQNGSPLIEWSSGGLNGPFSAPQELTSASHDVTAPDLATDGAGETVALWERSDGTSNTVEAAIRPAGGSFGTTQELTPAGENASWASLAVAPSGEAIAAWVVANGQTSVIRASFRPPGGGFGPPQQIGAPVASAEQLQVAIDPSGDAFAVWIGPNSAGEKLVQGARRRAGGQFGSPFVAGGGVDPDVPRVGLDGHGNAVVVWLDHAGGDIGTQVAESDLPAHGEGDTGPRPYLSYTGSDALTPALAVNAAGAVLIAWGTQPDFTIEAVARPPGASAFSAPHQLSTPGSTAFLPSLTLGAQGNGAAVWIEHGTNPIAVTEADYTPGGDKARPQPITPVSGLLTIAPSRFAIHGRRAVTTFRFRAGSGGSAAIEIDRLRGKACHRTLVRGCHSLPVGTALARRRTKRGRNSIRFNGWVGGRPLRVGLYLATLRVKYGDGTTETATQVFRVVHR